MPLPARNALPLVALALIVGCGGGAASNGTFTAGTLTTGTTGTGTSATNGGTTASTSGNTSGTTTGGATSLQGSYSGTFGSTVFSNGGVGISGPSGNATLVVDSSGGFTLSLGNASSVTGTVNGTGGFTGTDSKAAMGSVLGTIIRAGATLTVRYSVYTTADGSSGTLYVATVR